MAGMKFPWRYLWALPGLQIFPVKRKLLRSCIALTSVVRSNEQQVISVTVDVDTLTFDRCEMLILVSAFYQRQSHIDGHSCANCACAT